MVCHRSEGKLKQNETVCQVRKRGDERREGRRKEEEEEEEEGKRRPRQEKVSDHSSKKGKAVSCLSAKIRNDLDAKSALWSREDMESKFSHSAAIYEIHKSLRFLMRGGEQWDISVKKTP